jgi:hypothetical protein
MSYDAGLSMEERVTSLFQPDTLLPDQYLDTFRRKLHLEPEKKLMLAILEDAIACYQKYIFARDSKGKALFHEVEEWVAERGSGSVFAFDSVCESLGLNPAYLRRGMSDWTKAALAQRTTQARIYQLAPRPQRQRRNAAVSRKTTRRLRRATGR